MKIGYSMIVMMLVSITLLGEEEKLATINPYNGLQKREQVYEFTEKPKVRKDGNKWLITFTSKSYCDATVAILDEKGKIIRHLASGVLGKNAPYPFQQNSLRQKLEWDGEDDRGIVVSADVLKNCKVKVSLGLHAKFERDLLGSPYDVGGRMCEFWTSTDKDGNLYIVTVLKKRGVLVGRVFDKDGNYVRTFWPLSAKELEKNLDLMPRPHGSKEKLYMVQTIWGDKVLVSPQGPHTEEVDKLVERAGGNKPAKSSLFEIIAKKAPAEPKVRGPTSGSLWTLVVGPRGGTRLAVDRQLEELYVGANTGILFRLNPITGELDSTWTPIGGGLSDAYVGLDGLIYMRIGAFGYGQWIVRVDHNGNPVPWNGDSYDLWEYAKAKKFPDTADTGYGTDVPGAFKGKTVKALWTGLVMHSNIHDRGLYISPRGYIVVQMQNVCKDYAEKHKILVVGGKSGNVQVWSPEGKLLTADAVGPTHNGRGVAMDRDGNIYSIIGSARLPTGQKVLDGLLEKDEKLVSWAWARYGTLVKFRGRGGKYPLNVGEPTVKLGVKGEVKHGALWAYGGITGQTGDCMCHSLSYDMDYFARFWIPANHLGSVMVIDANGNRIVRLGCYGNVDDTIEDIKNGKDGLRFVWPRALAASDTALYVTDELNHRILKATLYYSAEETVSLQ